MFELGVDHNACPVSLQNQEPDTRFEQIWAFKNIHFCTSLNPWPLSVVNKQAYDHMNSCR